MMYTYYSRLGFFIIKNYEERRDIHNKVFNNIPHFIKNHLHLDYIQHTFVVYRDKLLISKREFIHNITDSIIPMYFCKKY